MCNFYREDLLGDFPQIQFFQIPGFSPKSDFRIKSIMRERNELEFEVRILTYHPPKNPLNKLSQNFSGPYEDWSLVPEA